MRAALDEAHWRGLVHVDEAEQALARAGRGRRWKNPERAWELARAEAARHRLDQIGAEVAALPARAAERESYLARHRGELERAVAVENAIETTVGQRVAEVEALAPSYLASVISEPPADPGARAVWRMAARLVENQRAALGLEDEGIALGPRSGADRDAAEWHALLDVQRARALTRPIHRSRGGRDLPDVGHGIDLDW